MTLQEVLSIDPMHWSAVGAAMLCGTVVGLERQLRGKPVGIRTATLVVLGTYIFIAVAGAVSTETSDPSRIIGQVVTGVGFLGAGVMLAKDGAVIGVTSAATIWALAALGACIALVGELVAIKLSLVVVGVLWGMDVLEDYSSAFSRGVHARYTGWRKKGAPR